MLIRTMVADENELLLQPPSAPCLLDTQLQPACRLAVPPSWDSGRDRDHTILLAKQTLDAGQSVLIFCGTKRVGRS